MLTKIQLTKKSVFYKIKSQKQGEEIIITAPNPKNQRQKAKLIKILKPFEGKIIYPKNFDHSEFPAPYPAFKIKCRNMILDFLNECKLKKPKVAVITPNGIVKDTFYFDISEYVGKIIINSQDENENLKAALLEYSGTVVEYNADYDSSEKSIIFLNLPKPQKAKNSLNKINEF